MQITINAADETIDEIVIGSLIRSMANERTFGDEPEYTAKYLAACELVIEHFGGVEALVRNDCR